jgi:tetratricopeptide (TPR) repeat protein
MTDVVERRARGARSRTPGRQAEPASVVATRALDMVGEDPGAAMSLADEALLLARRQRDGAATTTALRAQGLAARATGDLTVAEEKLRRAVRLALRRDDQHSAAEARMTLSFVLLDAGKVRSALRQSGLASTVLEGVEGARLLAQHGLILQRCGRTEAALEAYSSALGVLQDHGDLAWQARIYSNRGILHAYHGRSSDAEQDLVRAREIELSLGRPLDAAMSTWNLGFVAARRGDVVAALRLYGEADPTFDEHDVGAAERAVDRAQVLLSIGMADEARRLASAALKQLRRQGQKADAVECRILLGRAALASGDPACAVQEARAARREANRQQRGSWSLLARQLELMALEQSGHPGAGVRRRAEQLVHVLDAAGWREAAADARLTAARISASHGQHARMRATLEPLVNRRAPTLELSVRRFQAKAMVDRSLGDWKASLRDVRAAMSLLEQRRATLGAAELQVHTPQVGLPIAQFGVETAWSMQSPTQLFDVLEHWRAQNVRARPVRPPKDPRLSKALEMLRKATNDVVAARMAGQPTGTLEAVLARSEREVARASRAIASGEPALRPGVVTVHELREALDDAVAVELFVRGDNLGAVVVRGRGYRSKAAASISELGSLPSCLRELAHLQFALARLAEGRGTEGMLDSARGSAEESCRRLDHQLFGPIRDRLGDGPVVLVPSDGLHAVPWASLATLAGRPVHLVPSSTAWVEARARYIEGQATSRGGIVAVAGPGLHHAEREAAAIVYGERPVRVLAGAAATVDRSLEALQGARVGHIAAHGRFEADNPMMSSLQLADGPLMVYDLEDLAPPPLQVVLAACQSATARLHAGHELLGLAQALLWFGSSGVVATHLPAPDDETFALMRELHSRLAAGQGVAEALCGARGSLDASSPAGLATIAGFQAYGY